MPKIIFISDLHLAADTVQLNQRFKLFCENVPPEVISIYILGDLVRWWIGDDDLSDFNNWLIETLKILTAKIKVYLLPGNRDFLMGAKFAEATGIILLNDPTIISLNQQYYLLTHGDLLTNRSCFYQIFYLVSHSPLFKKLFGLLPIKFRTFIAKCFYFFSQKHHKKTTAAPTLIPNFTQFKKLAKTRTVNQIIYGHIHTEISSSFNHSGQTIYYHSLPMWKEGESLNQKFPSYTIDIP